VLCQEAVAMAASLVTQIGHNKVVNGIINHPRGFKQVRAHFPLACLLFSLITTLQS
jgi:hypothetical protein